MMAVQAGLPEAAGGRNRKLQVRRTSSLHESQSLSAEMPPDKAGLRTCSSPSHGEPLERLPLPTSCAEGDWHDGHNPHR